MVVYKLSRLHGTVGQRSRAVSTGLISIRRRKSGITTFYIGLSCIKIGTICARNVTRQTYTRTITQLPIVLRRRGARSALAAKRATDPVRAILHGSRPGRARPEPAEIPRWVSSFISMSGAAYRGVKMPKPACRQGGRNLRPLPRKTQ
jgi:hypothetical protein